MKIAGLVRALCAVLLMSETRTLHAQATVRPWQFAAGGGAQWRAVAAEGEPRAGLVADVVARSQRAHLALRGAVGLAHYTSPHPFVGRLCPTGGPCDYYAPPLTVATVAMGTEWYVSPRGPRALLGLGAYQGLSPQAQAASAGVPSARRGVRSTLGVQVGLVLPLPGEPDRLEFEVRYEWLAHPMESSAYFIPLLARFHW